MNSYMNKNNISCILLVLFLKIKILSKKEDDMKYKIIALDLDDTLLNKDGIVSRRNIETLLQVQKKGAKVIIASGRPTYAVKDVAQILELKKNGGYIISYNGARIINCENGKELHQINIPKQYIHKLFDMCMQEGAYIHTYMDNTIIASEKNKYTEIEKKLTGMEIKIPDNFKNYVDRDVVKAIVLQDPMVLQNIEKKWRNTIGNSMYMTFSKPFFLEFMNSEVDKGKGVIKLARILGLNKRDILAIGDSQNDISMLNAAGMKVAMGNATDEVKKMADYITDDNDRDGVAKAIEQINGI